MKKFEKHLKKALPIIKKVIKNTALPLLLLIFVWFFYINNSQIKINLKKIDNLTGSVNALVEENHQLRLFAFELCTSSNMLGDYLFSEEYNCAQFFPQIAEEQEVNVSLESQFISFVNTFFVQGQVEEQAENPEEIDVETNEENEVLINNIISVSKSADFSSSLSANLAEQRKADMQAIVQNDKIALYLADFGLHLEQENENLLKLKKEEEILADIYWDQDSLDVKVNDLTRQAIISLGTFNLVNKKAQYITEKYSTFDLEAFLQSVDKLEKHNASLENYLILGRHGANLDTMILASVDFKKQRITLVSIPRDLWLNSRKLNSYHAIYGMPVFKQKIEEITGQKIKHYVLIDMMAFVEVVDILGGIDYEFTEPLIDPSYRTVDNGIEGTLYFAKGEHHLNGTQALRVARTRHTSSDFARAGRQQEILKAIKSKIDEEGKAKSFINMLPILMEKVETDFALHELIPLVMKSKDFELRTGKVMSTSNILVSEMIEVTPVTVSVEPVAEGEEQPVMKAYALKPRDDDWALIAKFILSAIYSD